MMMLDILRTVHIATLILTVMVICVLDREPSLMVSDVLSTVEVVTVLLLVPGVIMILVRFTSCRFGLLKKLPIAVSVCTGVLAFVEVIMRGVSVVVVNFVVVVAIFMNSS